MISEHQLPFVFLAFTAAILGSWVALDLQEQARLSGSRVRVPLSLAAAVAFGTSIFVTHFVAMLGLSLHDPLLYDPWWTTASLILALVGSGLSMILVRDRSPIENAALAAGVMGGAICAMHYAGMEAIANTKIQTYDPLLLVLSLVIAVAASGIAIWFGTRRRSISARAAGALLLALAISGMHFTGMAAAEFETVSRAEGVAEGLRAADLALWVGAGALIVLFLALIASISARTRERERLGDLRADF